jgi:hypothetical protein
MALGIKPRISLFRYVAEQIWDRGVRVPHRVPLAETSTNGNRHSGCRPAQCRLNQSPPSTDLDGAMESGKHKFYALADGAKGDSRGMKQKAAGKKSLLIVTPSQAITNLDNLAVRMVIGLRPS